ncbi:dihydrodipicolinate synthase family protein [Paracoccus sp. JM45]|uniref:dihydrodipicolinate synthase family protein n=1 Tax=Paracoccus sp. JM45 TaxID=2283626 RepID=UPI000E6D23B0|nr:dihydrodipicolinate synthase family protein [Paracoccus sp. JM45]RJE81469.1 dihydrodipicolinate synthase family protein [Paracoccus sp. JM45]
MTVMQGLSAFPITPTEDDGTLRADDMTRLVSRITGVDSIGVLGSTGGYAYLTPDQRRHVALVAIAATSLPVIIGVGALRSDVSASLARHAADSGAAGLLLAPVSYTPLTEDEVFYHFQTVAGASDLPICVYNNPSTTHFTFSIALLARLAALPQVTAIKMPLPADNDFATEIARLRADLPKGFTIGYSGDWGCAAALQNGADSWFSVAAGLWPEQSSELAHAAQAGDATQWQARFQPLWDLFKTYGSLRVIYAAAHLMGLTRAQPPRPVMPLPDALTPRIKAAIDALTA